MRNLRVDAIREPLNAEKAAKLLRTIVFGVLLASASVTSAAPQKTFATPEEAVDAFAAALKADDDAALVDLFGEENKSLVVTPDRAANSELRARVAAALQTFHTIDERAGGRRVLILGDQAWPMPIPLVRVGDRWRFATEEGREELLNRRIGANERNAISVLIAYVAAQKEYASLDRDGDGVLQYAQRLASRPGKHDGLYWEPEAGKDDDVSPFGPLVAASAPYLAGHTAGDPYRGYRFRILTRQGKSAAGGAYSYVINGRMIAGFAMIAYPAVYGESGVMTFIISQSGNVYQKDLGTSTAKRAAAMTEYNPDPSWRKVED